MFVIEKLLSDHQEKVERWERARDKWVDAENYHYRSDYEESHPRPGSTAKGLAKAMLISFAIVGTILLVVGFAKEVSENNKNKPKEETVQTVEKNCQHFNKDDKVRIQYGDFTGNVGVIIGGCEEGNQYQVKIDDGSKANVSNDSNPEPVDVGGWTISVDSHKNLVVIEDKKE